MHYSNPSTTSRSIERAESASDLINHPAAEMAQDSRHESNEITVDTAVKPLPILTAPSSHHQQQPSSLPLGLPTHIIEWPGLKRTTVLIQFQPPAMCRFANHQTRLPRATCSLALNASRNGASINGNQLRTMHFCIYLNLFRGGMCLLSSCGELRTELEMSSQARNTQEELRIRIRNLGCMPAPLTPTDQVSPTAELLNVPPHCKLCEHSWVEESCYLHLGSLQHQIEGLSSQSTRLSGLTCVTAELQQAGVPAARTHCHSLMLSALCHILLSSAEDTWPARQHGHRSPLLGPGTCPGPLPPPQPRMLSCIRSLISNHLRTCSSS